MKQAKTIRKELTTYIEVRMAEQEADLQHVVLIDVHRCPLVNPLCPSDLCILPAEHCGTEEGYHVLGTDNYSLAQRYKDFPLMPVGTTDEVLVEEGWKIQHERFPEDEA